MLIRSHVSFVQINAPIAACCYRPLCHARCFRTVMNNEGLLHLFVKRKQMERNLSSTMTVVTTCGFKLACTYVCFRTITVRPHLVSPLELIWRKLKNSGGESHARRASSVRSPFNLDIHFPIKGGGYGNVHSLRSCVETLFDIRVGAEQRRLAGL